MAEDSLRNLQPGTIVYGRYEVVKGLGAGSMGMVYACRHRELGGRLVAMKVLFPEVAADRIAAQRFRNEIYASYEVNHPNVVRAYEYFVDGDIVAYTMEYVGGGDLAELISAEEPIPIPDIVKMLSQMCCGVQTIHSAGIIHRDLKPENILLSSQGDIKITDFGIARCGAGPKLTEHGGVVGTIDYVSPEYLELGQVDTRSDIYALGVLGYEMITGRTPFKGGSVIETMTLRLRTDPESPRNKRQGCPQELSAIILRAMMRNPDERYQTADEMLRDLDHVRDNMAELMKNVEVQERRPAASAPNNRFVSGSQRNSAFPSPESTQNYLPVKGVASTYNGPSYRPGSGSRAAPQVEPTASSNRLRAQGSVSAPVPIPMSRSATEMARPAEPLLSMVSDQDIYYDDEGGGSFIVQFLFWFVVILLGLIVGVGLVYAVSGGNADQFPVLQKVFRIMDIIRQ